MSAESGNPVVDRLRAEIAELDRSIVASVNRRLELVATLRRLKEEQGLPFLDPEREAWLRAHVAEENRGPLSDEGLRTFHAQLLDLVKRELRRSEPD